MQERKFPKSRKAFMLLGDIFLICLAYILTTVHLLNRDILSNNINLYSGMLPVIIVTTVIFMNVNGLYSIYRKRLEEIILSMLVTIVCMVIFVMALSFFIREFAYSRSVLCVTALSQLFFLSAWRYINWWFEQRIHRAQTVLLIGTKDECTRVYNRLCYQPQLNMKLKYICTDMDNDAWKKVALEVDTVLMCSEMRHRHKVKVINFCYEHGKQPLLIPNTFELFCSGIELDKIDDIPVFRLQNLHHSIENRILKRLVDLFLSGLGMICALPIMMLIAIAIKLDDHGPILYSQVRTGKDNKTFRVYKFRTMRIDAEKYSGPTLAKQNDVRITKVGRILRSTRLDELPQLWNVINGDMSIVGPRPERPYFVEKFAKENSEYIYRHNVKPGITGFAQVYGKYNTNAFDKLMYDLMYIQHCNFRTDLEIIIQTIRVLFTKSATEGAGIKIKKLNMKKYGSEKGVYEVC